MKQYKGFAFRASSPILLFLLTLVLVFMACDTIEEGEEPNKDIPSMIGEAKELLSEGEAFESYRLFLDVLRLDPENVDAKFGIVLCDVLQLLHLVEDVLELIEELAGTPETETLGGMEPLDGGIGDTIDKYIKEILWPKIVEMHGMSYALLPLEDFTFELPGYPVEFQGDRLADLGTQWDHSDVVALTALADLFKGIFDLLLSLDLNFDLGKVFALPINWTDLADIDLMALLPDLIEVLIEILGDPNYPNFLLLNQEGAVRMPAAGVELGLACMNVPATFYLIRQETDDQSDDIIGYVDLNDNGQWDPDEPMRIPGIGVLSQKDTMLLEDVFLILWGLEDALLDEGPIDVNPEISNAFNIALFNPLIMDLLGVDFQIIPEAYIPMGTWFYDPRPEEIKQLLLELLLCVRDTDEFFELVECIFAVISA